MSKVKATEFESSRQRGQTTSYPTIKKLIALVNFLLYNEPIFYLSHTFLLRYFVFLGCRPSHEVNDHGDCDNDENKDLQS